MGDSCGETEATLLSQCRPITCIEVAHNLTFVCEGPGISIFDQTGAKIAQKIIAASHKTIVGVSVWANQVTRNHDDEQKANGANYVIFAFGHHFQSLVSFDTHLLDIFPIVSKENGNGSDAEGSLDYAVSFIAARWLDEGRKLAAITDENILHIFDWGFKVDECRFAATELTANVTRRIIRGVTTSLFSATLSGTKETDLIVFSGTNLSSIYIWAPQDPNANYHLQIQGIKGSVLSVKYNCEERTVVASSDERSVFVWKLSHKQDDDGCGDAEWIGPSCLINNHVEVLLVAEMIGHRGRVWDVDVWGDRIVSGGQDSNLLLWNSTGKFLAVFSGSSVLSIRSCRFHPTANAVYAGADDGSVCRWTLSDSLSTKRLRVKLKRELEGEEAKENYPRQVLSYDSNHWLVSKSSGELMLTDEEGTCSEVFHSVQLRSYNVVAFSPDRKHLAVGSKNGILSLVTLSASHTNKAQREEETHFDCDSDSGSDLDASFFGVQGRCSHQKKLDSKIVSIHWPHHDTIVVATCTQVLVVLRDDDEDPVQWVNLFHFHFPSHTQQKPGVSAAIRIRKRRELRGASGGWDEWMVLGDELGSVHVFGLGQEGAFPLHTRRKVHGSYGVCDLKEGDADGELWSVGRSKKIFHFRLSDAGELIVLETIESCLDWNARLLRSPSGSFVCGFSENDFVMVDLEEDRIVKKVACGGAHRSWDVALDGDEVAFAFIRHKEVAVTRFALDSWSLKTGAYGGKTINVVTTFAWRCGTGEEVFVVTGGEEGVLRLTSTHVSPSKGVLCGLVGKLKGHSSSIRVAKCVGVGEDFVLVLSGGGRSEVVASVIRRDGGACVRPVWSVEASLMLVKGGDCDMRVMDLEVEREGEGGVDVWCACSDGFLRLLHLSLVVSGGKGRSSFSFRGTFDLRAAPEEGVVHAMTGVCAVESRMKVAGNSAGQLVLFAAPPSLDWKCWSSCCVEPSLVLSVVGSAMTSLCVWGEGRVVACGSDEGTVAVYGVRGGEWLELLWEDRAHHSAAVNSVCVLDCGLVVAASADQVVTVTTVDGAKCKWFRCGVMDVQDMAVTVTRHPPSSASAAPPLSLRIHLAGQGFEIRSLDF